MGFVGFVIAILGLALVAVLVYLLATGKPVSPEFKVVILVGLVIILFLCLGQHFGCPPVPTPHG